VNKKNNTRLFTILFRRVAALPSVEIICVP
jgi:hypothetical protein